MDQTWFKVRILLPFENDLISKWREAVMDILEHNTVSGNPRVALMHDNHLLIDFTKGWQLEKHQMTSACHLMVPSWSTNRPTFDGSRARISLQHFYQNISHFKYNTARMAVFTQTI